MVSPLKPLKPHPLDKIAPRQVLTTCFRTFGCFCRFVGILPIEIHPDGSATFRFKSKQFLLNTLTYVAMFVAGGIFYIPKHLQKQTSLKSDIENYISENLFVGGQFLGVVCTILLIPLMARRTAQLWNALVPLVTFISEIGQGHVYRFPYTRSRIALVTHIIMGIIYAIICWRDFNNRSKTGNEEGQSFDWLTMLWLVPFFLVCFCHLLPIMMFQFFVGVIYQSFRGLKHHVSSTFLVDPSSRTEKPSLERLSECLLVFEELTLLCHQLGRAFGIYLVLEMIVLMTSVLMNVFTMLSGFAQRDVWSTTGCFLGYVLILIFLSETGEQLTQLGKQCLKTLRSATYVMPNADGMFLHRIGNARSPKLSADYFFFINRQLGITMASTFATYIVVMIQFKLNTFVSSSDTSETSD